MNAAHANCPAPGNPGDPGWDDPIPYVLTELGKAAVQQTRKDQADEQPGPGGHQSGTRGRSAMTGADQVGGVRTMADITRDYNAGQISYAEFERQREQRDLELGDDPVAVHRELAEAPDWLTVRERASIAAAAEYRQARAYGACEEFRRSRDLEAGG